MKKSVYDFVSVNCYKYAPESFKAYFQEKQIKFNSEDNQKLGYIYITKGMKELEKEIKRIFRKSFFNPNKPIIKTLAIRTQGNEYIKISSAYGYGRVNIFDINAKLQIFKDLKKAWEKNNFGITITQGKMNEYGKLERGIVQELEQPKLMKRVLFV
jgi:hypothetical protein